MQPTWKITPPLKQHISLSTLNQLVHFVPTSHPVKPFTQWYLPPASEGWGKVIFSVCSDLWGGGVVPHPGLDGGGGGFTPSQVLGGGYPIQVWMVEGLPHLRISGLGEVPHPGLDGGGVPHLRSGGYPIQVWMVGGYPISGLGGTRSRSGWWGGTPSQVWGVPHPGLDGGGVPHFRMVGGTPSQGGTPAWSRWWGVPHPRGVPQPGLDVWGGTPSQGWGGLPKVPPLWPGLDGGGYPPPDRAA